MEWTHKTQKIGLTIEGTFECENLGIKNKSSLKSIKAEIDKLLEVKINNEKVIAYYYDGIREYKLTNRTKNNIYIGIDSEGKKTHIYNTVYKDTIENRNIIEKLEQLKIKRDKWQKQINDERIRLDKEKNILNDKLERFTIKDAKQKGFLG